MVLSCPTRLCSLLAVTFISSCLASERQLVSDTHFQHGFYLLEPKPGQRVVYGRLPGPAAGTPVWDLAQWSSRYPLQPTNCLLTKRGWNCGNGAKTIAVGIDGSAEADVTLAVNAGMEYPQARKSTSEPWVHLLVQQELADPPALGQLSTLNFHLEARLKRSRLVRTNDYTPSIHAAQFLVYLTIANRNPRSPGYQECFWFGVPIYDNRERNVSAYEAQDFGDTRLFIFTPSSLNFTSRSTHDGDWVTFEKDLLPLMRLGLEHAEKKGFIKGSARLVDYRPLGLFIGWEVPGVFDVDVQIRNLSLKAVD